MVEDGWTVAARDGFCDKVETLLKAGADLNVGRGMLRHGSLDFADTAATRQMCMQRKGAEPFEAAKASIGVSIPSCLNCLASQKHV